MNRLISSADPMGGVWSYTYDLAGNMLSEINPKGDTISYAYDKLNRIETVTDPYGVIITRNSYDANGNILQSKGFQGLCNHLCL